MNQTKQVLERLFPNIPSETDENLSYDVWLSNLSKHIELEQNQKQRESTQNNGKQSHSISHQNGNHSNDNGAAGASSNSTETEELVLQNAKLKSTVDEYKTIITETVSEANDFPISSIRSWCRFTFLLPQEALLKHLEKKVKEQDSYWRSVVEKKDSEISSLTQMPVEST